MGTGVLSKFSVAASPVHQAVKKLLFKQLEVDTVTALGTTQDDAVTLLAGRNMVLAADGTVGVALPPAIPGMKVEVVNTVSDQTLKVYAAVDEQINAISTASAFSLTAGGSSTFHCDVKAHWYVAVSNATGTATSASTAELDVLDGALATNLVAAKAAITTTNGGLTLGGAVTAVGSFIIGSADLNEADMEKLDGITNGQVDVAKAIVPTTDKHIDALVISDGGFALGAGAGTVIGATGAEINAAADRSTQVVAAGTGFTAGTGALHYSGVQKVGTLIKTTIFIDLTGTASSTTDLDIIGDNGTAAGSHIGQITAALNGTIFYGQITCLETPAGGIDDIIFYFADESTGTFDAAVSGLTGETVIYDKTSGWTAAAATQVAVTTVPVANKYMYLVNGAGGTAADYTAGQFLIELWGA